MSAERAIGSSAGEAPDEAAAFADPRPPVRTGRGRKLARWVARPALVACALLSLASGALLAGTWKGNRGYGFGFGQTWVQITAGSDQFDLRWLELPNEGVRDVLAKAVTTGSDIQSYYSCKAATRGTPAACWTLPRIGWDNQRRFECFKATDTIKVSCDRHFPLSNTPPPLQRAFMICGNVSDIDYDCPVTATTLRFPLWLPAAVFALPPSLAFYAAVARSRRRRRRGCCLSCGYNLTGNMSGVCPECGSGISACEFPLNEGAKPE